MTLQPVTDRATGSAARSAHTGQHTCLCGYPATSERDLEEHAIAAHDDQDHG
jgi:hypothetical protein